MRRWIVSVLVSILLASNALAGMEVTAINVGEGAATLILCDGEAMMIDAGGYEDMRAVYDVLSARGIVRLECVVATHADADHIGGMASPFSTCEIGAVYCPRASDNAEYRALEMYAEIHCGSIIEPQDGETFSLGGATVQFFRPRKNRASLNDSGVIVRISYGDAAILFMGDAGISVERILLNAGTDISADVLFVAHHGSASATSLPFVKAVNPSIAVVSVGENIYGHPSKSVMGRLYALGIDVYRTDKFGDVMIGVSDGMIWVQTKK